MKPLVTAVKNILFIILIVLLTGITTAVCANSGQGNQPAYNVVRPVAVIKVNPVNLSQVFNARGNNNNLESSSQNQKNMKVSWHNNANSDEDLIFTLNEDLNLNSSNGNSSGNNHAHGFVSMNSNSDYSIPADKILVSINGGGYKSFNEGRKVLVENQESPYLKFKVDESWLASSWKALPAGVYKADIDANIERQGRQPRLVVIIRTGVLLNLPDNAEINLTIDNPIEDKVSNSVNWGVAGNISNYQVKFESEGMELKDNNSNEDISIDYSSFLRYFVINGDNSNNSFAPGQSRTVNCSQGELELRYSPEEYGDKEWSELLAGSYKDKVTVTVSAN